MIMDLFPLARTRPKILWEHSAVESIEILLSNSNGLCKNIEKPLNRSNKCQDPEFKPIDGTFRCQI